MLIGSSLSLSGQGLYLSERRVSGEILSMLINLNASDILSFREENEVITVFLLDFVCVFFRGRIALPQTSRMQCSCQGNIVRQPSVRESEGDWLYYTETLTVYSFEGYLKTSQRFIYSAYSINPLCGETRFHSSLMVVS